MRIHLLRAAVAIVALVATQPAKSQGAQRVYLALADSVPLDVAAAASSVASALQGAGWIVLADYPVAADRTCPYKARVVVVHHPVRTATLLDRAATAPFAVVVRFAVFEDERGVHVAMVNPLSIDRTVVAESGLEPAGRALIADASRLVAGATRGRVVDRPFGQLRERGLIGKTMGVMAGGPFTNQVKTMSRAPRADGQVVADGIWERLRKPPAGHWGLTGIYRLDLPDRGLWILGVGGAGMEAKAFRIVGAGDDDSRDGFRCPGIAHAAAFPLEVVVRRDGGDVRVEAIDAMFRMKMYFEDAGRMKFARNMGMPGSIADELKAIVQVP